MAVVGFEINLEKFTIKGSGSKQFFFLQKYSLKIFSDLKPEAEEGEEKTKQPAGQDAGDEMKEVVTTDC